MTVFRASSNVKSFPVNPISERRARLVQEFDNSIFKYDANRICFLGDIYSVDRLADTSKHVSI